MAGLAFLLFLLVLALFAGWIAPQDPLAQQLALRLKPPSWQHWLGSDDYGRDQLSRLIYGTRATFLAALEAVAIGVVLGVPLGLIAGYFGGLMDIVLSRLMDALMSTPALILALTIVAVLGFGLVNAMAAVGIVIAPRFFRVMRSATQDVRQETYIEASNALGASTGRILFHHVLPNVLSPLVVQVSVTLGAAVNAEAGLSFLGVGVRIPDPSWGSMLTTAASNITLAPHLVWAPGIMIAGTVLAFTVLGDGLRQAMGTRRLPAAEEA